MARILVVEDEEDIRNLIQIRLRKAGHQVAAVGRPEEALRLVATAPPELVVLDVGLPEMNGLELLDRLRSDPALSDLPAVFLSAHVGNEQIEAGRSLGATYLTKPFIATALLNAVDASLKRASNEGMPVDSSDPYS